MERREFLRRLCGRKQAMRPPGAQLGEVFFTQCSGSDGCNECVKACPQKIVQLENGYPIVSFNHAGCTFCGKCIQACKQGALSANINLQSPWQWRALISSTCLDKRGIVCRACEASCPQDAIKFRPALGGKTDVTVLLTACTGCGACIASCPNKAISLKTPDDQSITIHKEAVA